MKDLVVLVADVQQEKTLETLLRERHRSLGIRTMTADNCDIYRHPRKDSGVYLQAPDFLAPYVVQYAYALVVLDLEWDGSPGNAATMAEDLRTRLVSKGWSKSRVGVIVIEPELEVWVWVQSEHVPREFGLTWAEIRELAEEGGYWAADHPKPTKPKELLEAILRRQHRPLSSALFQSLARKVSLSSCQDAAFCRLRQVLSDWFGDEASTERRN